ncbi:hypothetical protein SJAG_02837 [Schizosaccharomyces japonicus yFS275]|uniref:BRCT domain-containing protein n=1 Tax=Schizosaccharomyces japonicus (strain yFS275 / FY16936) TaxID=402676 RepID=B6K1B2_SCHJY|nr:hypothetical protein SJAG_02837 [Schizosaccharomyces japonicus yFS275]EEB07733.1 hypothetical protein SJAG_02837 [Schizosaccharomyces japonicus yFS275]
MTDSARNNLFEDLVGSFLYCEGTKLVFESFFGKACSFSNNDVLLAIDFIITDVSPAVLGTNIGQTNIPLVKSAWIHSCVQQGKIVDIRPFLWRSCFTFFGLELVFDGVFPGDMEVIELLVSQFHGRIASSISSSTTHFVTYSKESISSYMHKKKHNYKVMIVTPEWMYHSLACFEIRDESMYKLPLRETLPTYEDLLNTRPSCFRDLSICFGKAASSSEEFKLALLTLCDNFGLSVKKNWEDAHVYICHHRYGKEYYRALRVKKTVASFYWLLRVFQTETWIQPLCNPLYLPRVFGGINKLKDMEISCTGFSRRKRDFLAYLISCSGATFQKTLRKSTNILLAQNTSSSKYLAAMDWGITVVNHEWIQDAYRELTVPEADEPKYSVQDGADFKIQPIPYSVFYDMETSRLDYWGNRPSFSPQKLLRELQASSSLVVAIVTGYTSPFSKDFLQRLRKLGIMIVDDYLQCTHLIAPKIVKTKKFLCALPYAKYILQLSWLFACVDANKKLAEEDFVLTEPLAYSNVTISMEETLTAKSNLKHRFLHDTVVLILPSVIPPKKIDIVKEVIQANDGIVTTDRETFNSMFTHTRVEIVKKTADHTIASPNITYSTYDNFIASVLRQSLTPASDPSK